MNDVALADAALELESQNRQWEVSTGLPTACGTPLGYRAPERLQPASNGTLTPLIATLPVGMPVFLQNPR